MNATPMHPTPPDERGAHSLHRLIGVFLSLFLLYAIQNALAVSTVLGYPASHLISTQAGGRYDVHKFNAINNTRLERWNRYNLFCGVGYLLRRSNYPSL